MQTESIAVVHPGHYKRAKRYKPNRTCKCGKRLSVYNRAETCYTCQRYR